ncbi:hypothetical protein GOP47_0009171 [Adiantum capillus-veneris]|uniref:Uncharacterized protein n=1 Tax=Adiantum capillus-veneris TaxID=13818 RepID=A0A9D4UWH8_ADICA|nr:hypothetical protein GOP47_0009171 [Adiantum capillus-veneris]
MTSSSKSFYVEAVAGKEQSDALKAIDSTCDFTKPGADDSGQSSLTNMSKEVETKKDAGRKRPNDNLLCTIIEQKVAQRFGDAGGCC